jgi:hypothetical protein
MRGHGARGFGVKVRDKGPRRVRRRRSGERLVSSSAFFRASAFFRIQVFWLLLLKLTEIDACESSQVRQFLLRLNDFACRGWPRTGWNGSLQFMPRCAMLLC